MPYQKLTIGFIGSLIVLLYVFLHTSAPPNTAPIPPFFALSNAGGQILGSGFALNSHTCVAPDHLLSVSNRQLYLKGKKVDVLYRDTQKGFFHFNCSGFSVTPIQKTKEPLNPNDTVFWFYKNLTKGTIKSFNNSRQIKGQIKSGLIIITGAIESGMSGRAIFDAKGRVLGMIIGGNPQKKTIWGVPVQNLSNTNWQ